MGCPSLEPPADGYLVARNESLAVFRCSVGFVFEDSERHARVLACEHGNTWNDSLSACVNVSQTAAWRSGAASTEDSWTVTDGNATRITMAASGSSGDSDTVTSIIVPTVIMAMLFLGNAVVLYVLFILRRRNKKKCAQDEERAAIVKSNGSTKEIKAEEVDNGGEEVRTEQSETIPNRTENSVEDAQC